MPERQIGDVGKALEDRNVRIAASEERNRRDREQRDPLGFREIHRWGPIEPKFDVRTLTDDFERSDS